MPPIRRTLALLAAGAVATAGLYASPGAQADPSGVAVDQVLGIDLPVNMTLDPVRKTLSVLPAPGRSLTLDADLNEQSSRPLPFDLTTVPAGRARAAGGSPAGESYDCVADGNNDAGFKAYDTAYATSPRSEHDYDVQYRFFTYSLDEARFIGSKWTFQVERCQLGGGRTFNGYKQIIDGAGSTTTGGQPALIGAKWGTGTQDGSVSASLGFVAGKAPLTVNGTLNVTPRNGFAGSQGRDTSARELEPWSANEVNGYWKAYETHTIYDGTSDYSGNVSHALWEFPQDDPTPHQIPAQAWLRYICGRPYRRC